MRKPGIENRGSLPEPTQSARHRLEGAGADQGLPGNHERAYGNEGLVPKTKNEIRGPHLSEYSLERHQFEAHNQGNENEQAGAFQRNLFPCEQEQGQNG
jgi:hypothetical protein